MSFFSNLHKYFFSNDSSEKKEIFCNGKEKVFFDKNKTTKIFLSSDFSDVEFTLSEFERVFDSNEDVIQSNRNTLKQVDFDGVKTVIKAFKIPNAIQGFIYRYFRKSKARRSYEYSLLLGDLSIKTPTPLGYIEVYEGFRLQKSYFISSHLAYDFLIRDVIDGKVDDKEKLLKDFVAFTFYLHRNGVLHLDYSGGNVCIKKVDDGYDFYLVDVNRMRFGTVPTNMGVSNFSRISSSPEKIILFADEYSALSNTSSQVCQKSLLDAVDKFHGYNDRKRKAKQCVSSIKSLLSVKASSYLWDEYSNQPHVIKDSVFKRRLYFLSIYPLLKVLVTSFLLPLFIFIFCFNKRALMGKKVDGIGLCVNLDSPMPEKLSLNNEELLAMVDDLGVEDILVRIPLADFENIEAYYNFIDCFSGKSVLVNILQDRQHINDLALTRERFREIFFRLSDRVNVFQIGNTVNRRKWGFVSQDEYFKFFKVAQDLKSSEFNSINLLGGNIIDFEIPYYVRSLFHFSSIFYNGVATQLYVDRRGAPENTQFGFDTISKINFYSLLMRASPKSNNDLYITEVNWPIEEGDIWAPAQGDCMVSESLQAAYLVRYYLMMLATGRVTKCYWHQLVAPGYGLVNNLGGQIFKRDAYYCYKFLIKIFAGGTTRHFSEKNNVFRLAVETDQANVQALWTNGDDVIVDRVSGQTVFDMRGKPVIPTDNSGLCISGDVVYLVDQK